MKYLIILPVRAYQLLVSPLLTPRCRYFPSCSNYMIEAVGKHGVFRGVYYGIRRILRCAPWGGHGYDPVP
jgi:putative membrane protein insertion efficiency factor